MKKFTLILIMISLLLVSCAENDPVNTDTNNTTKTDVITSPDESDNTTADDETDTATAVVTEESQSDTDNVQTEDGKTENKETEAPATKAPETETETSTLDFKSDLSEYEKYMAPMGEERDKYLILVNSENALPSDFVPEGLTDVADTRKDGRKTQQMCLYAEKALEAFLIEARANGCKNVTVTSAYRDYAYQQKLFNTYINNEMNDHPSWTREEAEKEVRTYSAVAGTSEHQTGLACDMHNLSSAKQKFGNTFEGKWLAENAWKFGFILRYAEDKMDITGGIIYEPWHFRYVGRHHAKYMYDNNLCLEEYIEYLNNK